jgi:hypothetical protein
MRHQRNGKPQHLAWTAHAVLSYNRSRRHRAAPQPHFSYVVTSWARRSMLGALPYFGHIGPDWLAVGTRDSRRCAHQLGALLRGRDAVVNLIPYNTACAPRPHLRQDPSTSAPGPTPTSAPGPTPTSAPGPHPEYRDCPVRIPCSRRSQLVVAPTGTCGPAGCSAFARSVHRAIERRRLAATTNCKRVCA